MKTSLIRLSADWRAAVARIRGGPQERVIVVWPAKGGPPSPRLALRLMQRRSLRLQVPVAVVTGRAYIHAESETLGLPTFRNARQARKAEWGLSAPHAALAARRPRTAATVLRVQAMARRAGKLG
ncbi:MAG: hypothetical protein WEA61_04940 [Anaerolineales bacterium]